MASNATTPQLRENYIQFRLPAFPYSKWGRWLGLLLAIIFFMWLGGRVDGNPRGFVQNTINGILVGGIYSLIAVGIVMINKATGIFNFAHGAMMLLSSLVFFSFFTSPPSTYSMVAIVGLALATVLLFIGMNNWGALRNPRNLAIGAVATVLLVLGMTIDNPDLRLIRALIGSVTAAVLMGLVIERFSIRPLVGQPIFTLILMTLALDFIIRGFSLMLWGSIEKTFSVFSGGFEALEIPSTIRMDMNGVMDPARLGRITWVNIDPETLFAFIAALAVFLVFVLFFQYTNVGLAMRATAENQRLAQSVGLRVRAILAASWALAALLALGAGTLYGTSTEIGTGMPQLAIRAFPAVLLGGLESIGGALIGGIVIGLAQSHADGIFGNDAGTRLAPYVILMIVLIVRPDGLFGQKRIERI